MFSEACRNARGFTHPLVMCKKLPDGKTGCGIGAFFFVNRDGYAVTVSHVFKEYLEGVESGTAEKNLLKVSGVHGNGPDTIRPGPADGKTQYGFWFGD
ncbi:MAG: hypothetical protein MJZ68_04920, partial [archaeon]|nr:hypothetical protein [archaeon]